MPKLTKRRVDASRPKASDYFVFDSELPGFGLRVLPSGKKSYLVQYRCQGRTRRYTFGRHGPMTPEAARKEATALIAAIRGGGDPSGARHRKNTAPTMVELAARFLQDHVARHCKASTAGEYERSIRLFINPALGQRKVADVSRADVAVLHQEMQDTPYQANRTLGVLSKMFNLAEAWGMRPDGTNPSRHVKKYPEEKKERFLSPEEYADLWQVLEDVEQEGSEPSSVITALRLLMLTGCRLREILTLKWNYLREQRLDLPDSKSGKRTIHLGSESRDLLRNVERKEGNPYVICGANPGAHLTDLQKPWRRIRKRAGLDDVRIHDLRHSFASAALASGESITMIGKLLGHASLQSTMRYAHLAEESVRDAADRVASSVARHRAGSSDNRS